MKIVRLTAENFKRLVAVEIKPDGNTVLITGKNGAGKSCVLDAIVAVLCGKKYSPEKPIREGQDHAEVVIETENYIIKRTFTAGGGGSVTISNAEGMKASSPQALLDKIVGEIAFDPMMFINDYDARKQRDVLMQLAGLDFSDIDEEITEIKQKRSSVRNLKESYEHEASRITVAEETPDEEVSMSELTEKLRVAMDHNAFQSKNKSDITELKTNIEHFEKVIGMQNDTIIRLENQLAEAKEQLESNLKLQKSYQSRMEKLTKSLKPLVHIEAIQHEISGIEQVNSQISQKKEKARLIEKVRSKTAEYSQLGKKINELETQKAKRLSETQMPLEGLSVTEDGVVYEGIPLSQVNDAKKLEIGMNIAMAENPTLRVIRMKGNDLDPESLKMISKMAKAKDYQVWIERWLSEDGTGGIIIEDGLLKP